MMPNLHEIYDLAFFKEWGASNERYIRSAQISVDVLFDEFKPRRLIDLGCGCGVYSHMFAQKAVEVVAIDGVQPPAEHAFGLSIHQRDLTIPIENVWGTFDMAICLEVAEHLPEAFAEPFLDNITRFSNLLILS